jgi:hypothetical protein
MTNPNGLYEDMVKLNDLYDELCWGHDDELEFQIEYLADKGRIVIKNKTLEKNNERKRRAR